MIKFRDLYFKPRTICPDGFSVSIQANQGAYCTPRDNIGPWTHVELGYPSSEPPKYIWGYAEDTDYKTSSVYGYVPVVLVRMMLKEHGLVWRNRRATKKV